MLRAPSHDVASHLELPCQGKYYHVVVHVSSNTGMGCSTDTHRRYVCVFALVLPREGTMVGWGMVAVERKERVRTACVRLVKIQSSEAKVRASRNLPYGLVGT